MNSTGRQWIGAVARKRQNSPLVSQLGNYAVPPVRAEAVRLLAPSLIDKQVRVFWAPRLWKLQLAPEKQHQPDCQN